MLHSEQLGPEEFRFGTSTDQWRHKAAVPKEGTMANSTALEVFGLQASGLDFLPSDQASPLVDRVRTRVAWSNWSVLLLWSDLQASCRTPPSPAAGGRFVALHLDGPSQSF